MLLRGLSYKETGDALFIARTTVISHAPAVSRACEVANRRELIHKGSAGALPGPRA